MKTMVSFDSALHTVLSRARPLPRELVRLEQGLGRVLACEVRAPLDLPPFDNSAMDGYALRAEDVLGGVPTGPQRLKIVTYLPAGKSYDRRLKRGEAAKIMTGAPLPRGADAVVPVEQSQEEHGEVLLPMAVKAGQHVRRKGEDIRRGELLVSAGTRLGPREISLLSASGLSCVRVSRRPRLGVLATGDELVPPGRSLPLGKVYNANLFGLCAAAQQHGAFVSPLGVARDSLRDLMSRIRRGLSVCDLLLTSGGVSVGERDLVREALRRCGVKIAFSSVAMRPGKPFTFGTKGRKLVFGLPGNPVSSLLAFDLFVAPCLAKMSGRNDIGGWERALLVAPVEKKKGLRIFLKGIAERREGKLWVRSAGPQGSGVLSALAKANCLIMLPEDRTLVRKGVPVAIRWL